MNAVDQGNVTYTIDQGKATVEFSHPLSMLLTLSLWQSSFNEE